MADNQGNPVPLTLDDIADGVGTRNVDLRGKRYKAWALSASEDKRVRAVLPQPAVPSTFHKDEDGTMRLIPNPQDVDYRARRADWSVDYGATLTAMAFRLDIDGKSYSPAMSDDEFKSWAMKARKWAGERFTLDEINSVVAQITKLSGPGVGEAMGNSSPTPQP